MSKEEVKNWVVLEKMEDGGLKLYTPLPLVFSEACKLKDQLTFMDVWDRKSTDRLWVLMDINEYKESLNQ